MRLRGLKVYLNNLETLLYSIKFGAFDIGGKKVAFLNAAMHPDMLVLKAAADLTLQQYFRPYVDDLIAAGFSVSYDITSDDGSYDLLCIALPKNMTEARYLIARGARLLRSGGTLICAADNKAGGLRLKKLMQNFGFSDLQGDARNKARSVWGVANHLNKYEIDKAIIAGEEQEILGGKFISRAGVFGWDKIDKGSQILLQYIPADLKGKGADFGCGYGYLSRYALLNCKNIKKIYCADADYRAVGLCKKNLAELECDKEFIWCDLTKSQDDLHNLDFIIMNPPFHDGKKTDISIGQGFINIAYQSLRRGGRLFMVANNHLAYEYVLNEIFFKCNKLYEGQGFKVFCSVK